MPDERRRLIVCSAASKAEAGDFILSPAVWYVVASTAASACNVSLAGPTVNEDQAKAMATAIESADLDSCAQLFAGLEKSQAPILAARAWWSGDEGQERLANLLTFLRSGSFEIVIVDYPSHFEKSKNYFEKPCELGPLPAVPRSQRSRVVPRNSKDKLIRINSCGPRDWLRYFIQRGGEYWTGAAWSTSFREARLYAHLAVVMEPWAALSGMGDKDTE